MSKFNLNIFLILLFLFSACSKDIPELDYLKDQCEHCKMTLTDKKYGALIFTKKGKSIKFDATECMLDYLKENKVDGKEVDKYFVVNLNSPGKMINAESAQYLANSSLQSPMGENISAFAV
ncbi:MAG: nitrous oxide reductase accessory protein NosL, partial [bacterium]